MYLIKMKSTLKSKIAKEDRCAKERASEFDMKTKCLNETKKPAIQENTVAAENQVSDHIYYLGQGGPRVLIVGNSITLHGPNANIGWTGCWGMAASAREKDYVHLLFDKTRELCGGATFCVVHAGIWERAFWDSKALNPLEAVKDFRPDFLIFRLGENIVPETCEQYSLFDGVSRLLEFLTIPGETKSILTTCFWKNPKTDAEIHKSAKKFGALVELGDLGDETAMKASGLFKHTGVAAHPGDLGMRNIAERIWQVLSLYLILNPF
ncbi:MAG: hypothetical protein PHH84_06795 [Oscillospiraceae bacterium]|nr:hypothetical protein [Oscillospiraceae bacterium]MDD4414529.1 hypothetical protein [Oscillospiraceae bacterium]